MSQTRADLFTAIRNRIVTLGHAMNSGEIEAIVNDVQGVIVTDNATTARQT
jgi:hypothetical protein